MRTRAILKFLTLLAPGLLFAGLKTGAATFDFFVTSSTTNFAVANSNLTFTINVTNRSGFTLPNVFVTNTLAPSVVFQGGTFSQGSGTNFGNRVIFFLGQLPINGGAQLTVVAQPTVFGFITNVVTVAAIVITNEISTTNIITQVITGQADLRIALSGSVSNILPGDPLVLTETVTNPGPNSIPNVILSNSLPAGVSFVGISPASQTFTNTGTNVIFNLGTITNNTARTFTLTFLPTNSGSKFFLANVSAAGLVDTNSTNDTASTNVLVNDFLGQLVVVTNSSQTLNHQTGLMEQMVLLSNIGTSSVPSARVLVSGLTNRLYNAGGTNNGIPYVVYANTLNTNQSVNLLLEFFVPPRQPFPLANSQLQAVGVFAVNVTSPTGTNGTFSITNIFVFPSGNILIGFPAIAGRTYTILYSDTLSSSNPLVAQPSIVAPANFVQWIDDGPPKTISRPADVPSRFYRVLLNP